MPLFEGIAARTVQSPRLTANVLYRAGQDDTAPAVVFVHGNVSSSLFWQDAMLAVPAGFSVWAIDLRGFGDSETLPVDATRGVRDFSDDVAATIAELGLGAVHIVGWSMGGGVVLQYALDHPVLSLTVQAPVSPYGFGGTAVDGSRLTDDDAGTGGGGANPGFVANIEAQNRDAEDPLGALAVYKSSYVHAGFESAHEDTWVESMFTTKTGVDNYPGDATTSENWPGFAAGTSGVLNTMTPRYFDVSGIVDLAVKPDILWIRGDQDAIVSDASYFDINYLGEVGVIPGWPGADVAPAQQMITQTRAVFDSYAAQGGSYREVVFEGAGHSPHLEQPQRFADELSRHIAG